MQVPVTQKPRFSDLSVVYNIRSTEFLGAYLGRPVAFPKKEARYRDEDLLGDLLGTFDAMSRESFQR